MDTVNAPAPTPPPARGGVPLWLVGFVLLVVAGLVIALFAYRGAARANGLRADSLVAVLDTERVISNGKESAFVLRVLQSQLVIDSLDILVKQKPKVKIVTVVTVDTLRLFDTVSVAVDANDVRSANFTKDTTPFHVKLAVSLPPPPRAGQVSMQVSLDSIPLDARIGCGEKVGGVRSATTYVTAPPWAKVGLRQVQADPDVCNATVLPGFDVKIRLPWWASIVTFIGGVFTRFIH